MKTKWGFAQFVSLETLRDPCSGYLVDDCCMFGAEVFVIKHTGKWESLALLDLLASTTMSHNAIFTWVIQNFSKLNQSSCQSDEFCIGGKNWYAN